MPEDMEEDAPVFDSTPTPTATRGFSSEQMVGCEACLRANPPTRMNCLYCGASLPVNETNAALRRPVLRPLEEWEAGFDVLLLPREAAGAPSGETLDQTALAEVAAWLRLEDEELSKALATRKALPLARASTREEASLVEEKLSSLGLAVAVVPDEAAGSQPLRVRRLEFGRDALKGWDSTGAEAHVVAWADVRLLVRGRLFTKQSESEERRSRLGTGRELVDARELVEDEAVIDIFSASSGDVAGETLNHVAGEASVGAPFEVGHWRIEADGFDYSCLGERKKLLAGENFETLSEVLRARVTDAAYDDDYWRVRHLLAKAWPLAERTESRGLRRSRPGKFNVEAATIVSNEMQFTRYARMCYEVGRRTRPPQR